MAFGRCLDRSRVLLLFPLSAILFHFTFSDAKEPGDESTLPNAPSDVRPLLVGTHIPDVDLKITKGRRFDLKDALSKKPTVLVFYRGFW